MYKTKNTKPPNLKPNKNINPNPKPISKTNPNPNPHPILNPNDKCKSQNTKKLS